MAPETKKPLRQRKEVHLTDDVVKLLEKKAKDDKRNLKNYMEKVLIDDAKEKK